MKRVTKVSAMGFAGVLLAGTVLYSPAADATQLACTSYITLAGGNGNVLDSALTSGVCVRTVDATFGTFNFGNIPTGGSVAFNLTNFGTPLVGYHGISFSDNFVASTNYALAYGVEISAGSNLFANLDGDFTQNNGTSTLTVTTTEAASSGSVDWTKVGATGSGPDQLNYSPGEPLLLVTDSLSDGGSVSAISNNAVENGAVSTVEPTSLALLGTAFIGVGTLRFRKKVSRAA
jgi:hypothetical protein